MSLPFSLPWSWETILAAARAMAGGGGFAPTLLAALASPHADSRHVVAAIHSAPGIALRVLKVANSAFYGRAGQVDTLDRAVQVLGLDAVRSMASAACLDRVMPGADLAGGPSAAELQNHSLASAVLARDLALLLMPERAADAFLAGLLHDLGYRVVQRPNIWPMKPVMAWARTCCTTSPGRCPISPPTAPSSWPCASAGRSRWPR